MRDADRLNDTLAEELVQRRLRDTDVAANTHEAYAPLGYKPPGESLGSSEKVSDLRDGQQRIMNEVHG
jgi:hypothetical protein